MIDRMLPSFAVVLFVMAVVVLLLWQDLGAAVFLIVIGGAFLFWGRQRRDAIRERDEIRAELRESRSTGAWEGVQSGSPPFPGEPYFLVHRAPRDIPESEGGRPEMLDDA